MTRSHVVSAFKGTPGPWRADAWACHARTSILSDAPTPETIEGLPPIPGPIHVAECSSAGCSDDEANAALIAQAPAMLMALQDILVDLDIVAGEGHKIRDLAPETLEKIDAIFAALRAGGAL